MAIMRGLRGMSLVAIDVVAVAAS
ncbi:hypothetical protein [Shewanella sp. SR43-4]